MNIFAYNSQDPAVVGPKVAEIVAKEMGGAAPEYELELGDAKPTGFGSVMKDVGRTIFGGRTDKLFTLIFRFSTPRAAEVRCDVIRSGVGCVVTPLVYMTNLAKSVTEEAQLADRNAFGSAKFTGGALAVKLNGNGDLVKRANKLARPESSVGALMLQIQRVFGVFPGEGTENAALVVVTLPRPTSMGMNVAMDLKEFFDLADILDKMI